jgi:uncharacterized membrane protein YebE (DUF533 family)
VKIPTWAAAAVVKAVRVWREERGAALADGVIDADERAFIRRRVLEALALALLEQHQVAAGWLEERISEALE